MSTQLRSGDTFHGKINPAIAFSVRHYVMMIGFFLAVVIFGIISTFTLGVNLFPSLNIPVVAITTVYPGATPRVVDQQITQVIEDQVSTLSGITDINSYSLVGRSTVVLYFGLNTDKNADAQEVASNVAAAIRLLPSGVDPPTVGTYDPNSAPILQFGISGGGAGLEAVSNYVDNELTPALERVPGVANVSTDGGPRREFQVLLNPDKLRADNLSPVQVVRTIENSAVNIPIGTIELNKSNLSFQTQNVPADVHAIASYVVDSARGLTVGDLGSVRDVAAPGNYARINGQPVVLVSVRQTSDGNQVAVVDGVRKLLARTPLPAGYSIQYSNDTSGAIRASINSTYHEMFITAIFVTIVVLLFLGRLNTAFSVILAIPIALSAGPALYRLAGFTFNTASLLALVVAIGVVVDDSIVVSENVTRYRVMGYDLKQSVLRGASEVFGAVLAASLSILSVVLSVSFIGGVIGEYLRQFTFGLAAAVLFSLLEALLFLTIRLAFTPDSGGQTWKDVGKRIIGFLNEMRWGLTAWRKPLGLIVAVLIAAAMLILHHPKLLPFLLAYPIVLGMLRYLLGILLAVLESATGSLHAVTEAGLEWVRERYVRSLGSSLLHPQWVLIGAVVFFIVTIVLVGPRIAFTFVPNSDNGVVGISLALPPGTPQDVTNRETGKIEEYLFNQAAVSVVQTVVGSSGSGIVGASQPNDSNMVVQLTALNTRPNEFTLIPKYRDDLQKIIHADQPSAVLQVNSSAIIQSSNLTISLVSSDLSALTSRNSLVLNWLQNHRYVADVSSSLSTTTLENNFVPDNQQMQGTGITPADIASALQYYTSGVQAGNVWIGGLSYPITVQIDPTHLSGGESLLNLPIYSPILGTSLNAGQLGSFALEQTPTTITRYNREYSANLNIDLTPDAPALLTFQNEIKSGLKAAKLIGNGVDLASGNSYGAAALTAQLAVTGPLAFVLAFFFAYLVMGAQFNSWRYPVYLLLPVPLAIVGALWLVFALHVGIDVYGILGMILLIGLSAKNAIIYLDFVVERLGKVPFREALLEAARLRFRPIIMTTLTVLVIGFPLILGHGEGSEYGRNLGIVMAGGIVFSAALTFFVVPAAFFLFERKRIAARPVEEES